MVRYRPFPLFAGCGVTWSEAQLRAAFDEMMAEDMAEGMTEDDAVETAPALADGEEVEVDSCDDDVNPGDRDRPGGLPAGPLGRTLPCTAR